MSFVAKPQGWPSEFNDILRPTRSWVSPTVPGIANALVGFEWLKAWGDLPDGSESPLASVA